MNNMLIGISGKIKSGKDTVAQIIIEQFRQDGIHFEVRKFADKLKQITCLMTGCRREDLEDQDFKSQPIGEEWGGLTYRSFMQLLGTEAMRNEVHEDAWVNALFADYKPINFNGTFSNIETSTSIYPNWIITDVRFPNEVKAIKERGGMLIRVNRDLYRGLEHVGETLLDDYDGFDLVIDNNGTLEDLRNKLNNLNLVK